jgi:hypothetical protein
MLRPYSPSQATEPKFGRHEAGGMVMRGRGVIAVLSCLLVIAAAAIVYFVATRAPSAQPGTSAKPPDSTAPAKPRSSAEIAADLKKRYESAGDPKSLEAVKLEVGKAENAKALAAVATDAAAPMESRQVSLELLAASKVRAEVLFPVVFKVAEEKNPALADRATEALATLLDRGEKVPDESKAVAVLAASAKPANSDSARIAAARGLAKLKSKAAVEALVELLRDEQSLARRFAGEALKNLLGDGFGYDYRLKPEAQKESMGKRNAWAKGYSPRAE